MHREREKKGNLWPDGVVGVQTEHREKKKGNHREKKRGKPQKKKRETSGPTV